MFELSHDKHKIWDISEYRIPTQKRDLLKYYIVLDGFKCMQNYSTYPVRFLTSDKMSRENLNSQQLFKANNLVYIIFIWKMPQKFSSSTTLTIQPRYPTSCFEKLNLLVMFRYFVELLLHFHVVIRHHMMKFASIYLANTHVCYIGLRLQKNHFYTTMQL